MSISWVEVLHRCLDWLYGWTDTINPTAVRVVVMYIYGLFTLLLISAVLAPILARISVWLEFLFEKYGRRGPLEAIGFSARLYCSAERILWRSNPIRLWFRLFRWRPIPVLFRVPLNALLHAFSFTISNFLIWASIFIYLRPELPTQQKLLELYGFVKNVEITKILAWISLILVVGLLQQGAPLRARIRHEEDSYVEAIKHLSELESPLRLLAYNCEQNLTKLLLDSRTRFPQLFVTRILDSANWAYSAGELRTPHRWETVEVDDLENLQRYTSIDEQLKTILDVARDISRQQLWSRAHRLLSRVRWELSELGLPNAAAVVESGFRNEGEILNRLAFKFMAPGRILELITERTRYHEIRYAFSSESSDSEAPRIDLQQLDGERRARLQQDLGKEANAFSEECQERIAKSVAAVLCAQRIASAISELRTASQSSKLLSRMFKPFG
jgi:hypothetical protein